MVLIASRVLSSILGRQSTRHTLLQTPLRTSSSRASRLLSTSPARRTKAQPRLGEQPLRACGVADTATEAGPRDVGGILRPEAWIIAGTSIIALAFFYLVMPSSPSKTGHAVQKRILGQRQALERREGDREREETEAEKLEEAEIIRNRKAATSKHK